MEITPAAKHASVIALTMALLMASCGDKAMQHKNGRYTVNTTTIAPDVIGYNGPTPLLIHISNDKVESIEVLENGESPSYFEPIEEELLIRWNGLTVNEAINAEVDAVSGSTYSSEAVISNVRRGLRYYQSHK